MMFNDPLVTVSLVMTIFFFIIGLIFASLKDKACILISGYNFKSKKQREQYDEKRLSADMRNQFFLYSLIFLIGSICTYLINSYCFWLTLIIWLVVFFRGVHFDDEKAFGKYKK